MSFLVHQSGSFLCFGLFFPFRYFVPLIEPSSDGWVGFRFHCLGNDAVKAEPGR